MAAGIRSGIEFGFPQTLRLQPWKGIAPKPLISFKFNSKRVVISAAMACKNEECFKRGDDGFLYCEGVKIEDIQNRADCAFYLYSKPQIRRNLEAYKNALLGLPSKSMVGYALKANADLVIVKLLKDLGCGAVVSGRDELKFALDNAGFDPSRCVFYGDANTLEDFVFAVKEGVFIDINWEDDLRQTVLATRTVGKKAKILINVIPDLDPKVHPHVRKGVKHSNFGIPAGKLQSVLDVVSSYPIELELAGLHYHLGSMITSVDIYRDAAAMMVKMVDKVRAQGFDISYLNIGGGLAVDYHHDGAQVLPTPQDLIDTVREAALSRDLNIMVEPGRSLIANTCSLVTHIHDVGTESPYGIGCIIVDAHAGLIQQSRMYKPYHHIELISPPPPQSPVSQFHVVGLRSENLDDMADFIGMYRDLPVPARGSGLLVRDTGAYCNGPTYSSDRTSPAYWVEDDGSVAMIRRRLTWEEETKMYLPE